MNGWIDGWRERERGRERSLYTHYYSTICNLYIYMKYKLRPPPVVLILFSMPYLNLFTSHIPQGSRNSPVKGCRVASSVKWRLSQPSHWEGGHRFSGSLPCLLQRTVLSPWRPGRSLGGSWMGLDPGSPAWMSPWAQGAPSQGTVSDHPLLRSVPWPFASG